MDLRGELKDYLSTLKRVHIPDDQTPNQPLPKSVKGIFHFIAVHKGRNYYVDTAGLDYARYVLAIFDGGSLIRYTVKVGDIIFTDQGELVIERVQACTFPWDNNKEGFAYFCKPIVKT